MENKIKQLRKGILELSILGCLHNESHYGYSLIKALSGESDIAITEGTIYPILSRLAHEELVHSEWVESRKGPPRKYYSLTGKGKQTFEILNEEFAKLTELVANASKKTKKQHQERERKKIFMKKERTDGE